MGNRNRLHTVLIVLMALMFSSGLGPIHSSAALPTAPESVSSTSGDSVKPAIRLLDGSIDDLAQQILLTLPAQLGPTGSYPPITPTNPPDGSFHDFGFLVTAVPFQFRLVQQSAQDISMGFQDLNGLRELTGFSCQDRLSQELGDSRILQTCLNVPFEGLTDEVRREIERSKPPDFESAITISTDSLQIVLGGEGNVTHIRISGR